MALGARSCPPANLSREMVAAKVNRWGTASTATMEMYDQLAREQWVADLIGAVRGGEEWKKQWLPFRCAHFYRFGSGHRNQKSLLKEAFLWQTTVDIDDCDAAKQQAAIERALELNDDAESPWHGMVLQIERSARRKVHLDVRMPVGMTIQQTQLAFIEALGVDVKPDTSCFSPERIIFISGIAEEIFRSPQWYALLPEDEVAERFEAVEVPWEIDRGLGRSGLGFRVKSLEAGHAEGVSGHAEDLTGHAEGVSGHAEGVTGHAEGVPGLAEGVNGPAEGVPSPSLSQGERDGTAEPNSQSSILEQTERNQASLNCRGAAENHSEAVILNPQLINSSKLSTLNSQLNDSEPNDSKLYIFDKCMEEAGLKPEHLVVEGARHNSLKSILSVGAAQLLTKEELKAVLRVRMAEHCEDANIVQLVDDFYKNYHDSSQRLTAFQRKLFAKSLELEERLEDFGLEDTSLGFRVKGLKAGHAEGVTGLAEGVTGLAEGVPSPSLSQGERDGTAEPNSQSSILNYRASRTQNKACFSSAEAPLIINAVNFQLKKGLDDMNAYLSAETPPQMPSPLPPFIEVICSHVPEEYKPAVAMSSFVAMGCHPEGLWWNYIDQRRHEPAFMHTVVATQSVGKSCVNKPLEYLMEDIRLADEVNRQREAEWKQNRSSKGANKEKPKRPEGLRIQITEPDMTNAALVQRLDDVGEKFLFTNMDELELLNNLRSGARGNQVSQLIRLAFDQGFYGQERVGADSVTARVQVRWNWNAGCTVAKAQRFFRGAVTDGTLSRISFSTIIEDPSGRMPMFKPYDDSYAEALKPFIDRLNEATGEVHCEEADALAWRLNEDNQQIVTTSFDEVFKIFCRRANVLAHQRAMMLWLAHGRAWSKEIEDFVVWSEKYDLWCKMHFFGQMMEDEMKQEYLVPRRGPRNFLTTLDRKTFDMRYLQVKIREASLSTSASLLVSQWKYRKLISVDESGMITVLI